jgi:hypothetical protein
MELRRRQVFRLAKAYCKQWPADAGVTTRQGVIRTGLRGGPRLGAQSTLLVYIGDVTSQLMHLQFVESESTFDYFAATRAYLESQALDAAEAAMAASNPPVLF